MSASAISLPNNWRPRGYQLGAWRYLEGGGKRAVLVWHRRAGKDDLALHWTAVAANDVGNDESIGRVGTYWHMLPEAAQARKAIWEAVNPHTGLRRVDEAFPSALRETTREQEMFIRFKSRSTWQVVGSDNYDSLVGSPPVGVVFSEWALADPQAWAYIRPILLENGGWALFPYTPRGRNHGAAFYETLLGNAEWHCEKLTALQTDVFTEAQLDHEKREYIREFGETEGLARFNQEYLCDFNAAVVGAYFGPEMNTAEAEGRICRVPHDPGLLVQTWWDLGYDDLTAIWFVQYAGRELRFIDYIEGAGGDAAFWAKELQQRPYNYGDCILPHDAGARSPQSGKTYAQVLADLGLRKQTIVPRTDDLVGSINQARLLIPRSVFDAEKCKRGIEALRQYRREWDDKMKTFKARPMHDWASHGADAYRQGAQHAQAPTLIKTQAPRLTANAWLG